MAIFTKDLSKKYGDQVALDNVNIDLKKGKIIGLLGPNGAGKSTLMKILTGFIPADSGYAKVCDLDCLSQSLQVRKIIGYLPENNPLYEEMYVIEFLKFVADLFYASYDSIHKIIKQVGLTDESHKKIHQLSKGYKQRVGLASSLIHNPDVLILDEPTTGLDPNQLIEIRKLIRTIGENKTVLLSTHIMQEVEALCDQVIFIQKGKIVREASIKEFGANKESLEEAFRKATK
jgi:ABC-2 type transport system ATP-binding protein